MTVFPFLLHYFYQLPRWWKQHGFNTLVLCEVSKEVSSASCSNRISQSLTAAATGVYSLTRVGLDNQTIQALKFPCDFYRAVSHPQQRFVLPVLAGTTPLGTLSNLRSNGLAGYKPSQGLKATKACMGSPYVSSQSIRHVALSPGDTADLTSWGETVAGRSGTGGTGHRTPREAIPLAEPPCPPRAPRPGPPRRRAAGRPHGQGRCHRPRP